MVQNQIYYNQVVTFHEQTTNQSFIDMAYILQEKGITNNKFFLAIYDRDLIGVDPRDPNLSPTYKMKILRECMINYWYYLREVVRIPDQGGSASSGKKFKLHRGNLAMNFLFMLNYNMFVELPRQHGKTTAALVRYLWVFNFGTTNSEIIFIHKNHDGSKGNLANLKILRGLLPSYLQMSSVIGVDGKQLKVSNTVETLQHPTNNNKIRTLPSARSKSLANGLARGLTVPLFYYDEFAFIMYNRIIYNAATPAYKTASNNAKNNGSPYGILITTTPGELTTDEGRYAFDIINNATPWDEQYYNLTYQQLEELREANQNSSFFYVRYTYQQLGSGEKYLREMVVDMNRDWAAIRREVLLEWAMSSDNCPFKYEDLEMISQHIHEPIRTIFFGRAQQYQLKVYEELDPRYPPIIGVDVSGALRQDSSAITIIDSKTTRVVATLNCNYMPADDLAEILYILMTKYMPNAVCSIERNGGFGNAVIQRLSKTSVKKNLYYEIKDRAFEERYDGIRVSRQTQKVKVYGLDSTKSVRSRLIELLYERVNYHKDKFIAPILYNEMKQMEVKKNGKVEHSINSHDDQVFSYLMAIYVWYDGQNLMERYNIMKNNIRTDDDDIDEVVDLEELDSPKTSLPITEKDESERPAITTELTMEDLIESSSRQILSEDFYKAQEEKEQLLLKELMNFGPAKDAYISKYHIDPLDVSAGGIVGEVTNQGIPDSFFIMMSSDTDDIEYMNPERNRYAGNLGKEFAGMFDGDDDSSWR